MIERVTESEDQTIALAASLGRTLRGGELIALDGPLGVGKTRFVKGLALGMGLDPHDVCSPTFVLCRRYGRLAHVDAFRLEGPEALESIGWDELIADRDIVVAVEWSSRISDALPSQRIDVNMTHAGTATRRIVLNASGGLVDRVERIDERATH